MINYVEYAHICWTKTMHIIFNAKMNMHRIKNNVLLKWIRLTKMGVTRIKLSKIMPKCFDIIGTI